MNICEPHSRHKKELPRDDDSTLHDDVHGMCCTPACVDAYCPSHTLYIACVFLESAAINASDNQQMHAQCSGWSSCFYLH